MCSIPPASLLPAPHLHKQPRAAGRQGDHHDHHYRGKVSEIWLSLLHSPLLLISFGKGCVCSVLMVLCLASLPPTLPLPGSSPQHSPSTVPPLSPLHYSAQGAGAVKVAYRPSVPPLQPKVAHKALVQLAPYTQTGLPDRCVVLYDSEREGSKMSAHSRHNMCVHCSECMHCGYCSHLSCVGMWSTAAVQELICVR